MNIVFIDNFDSFTYNLTDELSVLGCQVKIFRNDVTPDFVLQELAEQSREGKTALVLSPGPSAPKDAGNLLPIIEAALGRYPLLGICLGHQAIAQVMGGRVVLAPEIYHGKSSPLEHDGGPIFKGIANPVQAARYHSLMVTDLPPTLHQAAKAGGVCMAYYCEDPRLIGLQFHPESVLTTQGRHILQNCLEFLSA